MTTIDLVIFKRCDFLERISYSYKYMTLAFFKEMWG